MTIARLHLAGSATITIPSSSYIPAVGDVLEVPESPLVLLVVRRFVSYTDACTTIDVYTKAADHADLVLDDSYHAEDFEL